MSGVISPMPSQAMNIPLPSTDTLAEQGGVAPFPPNKPDQTPGTTVTTMPGMVNPNVAIGK